jgi:site-specific DNA-methyltransferase (adenine-specific)
MGDSMNKVIHGDCLEVMPTLPDKSIDMILCDLPYGTTACKWDTVVPFEPLWKEYKRLIKDNGAIVLTASQPFTSALVMSNPKMYKHSWVWNKRASGNFVVAKYMPLTITEDVIVFCGGKVRYFPLMIPQKPRTVGGKSSAVNGRGFGGVKNVYRVRDEKYPVNLLDIPAVPRVHSVHSSQKPVALFEYLIKTYTNEGETVLDNCAGSGTTAIACINTNRNYILIEKEKEYIDVINKRISEHEQQLTITL